MPVIISKEAKMAAKKGEIPEHIKRKKKKFHDPQADHPIIRIFNKIDDPRKPSLTFSYPLTSILFMTLVAIISGATDCGYNFRCN